LFARLLDAALEAGSPKDAQGDRANDADWRVDDSWSLVRRRRRMQVFRATVLKRHNYTCLVCGTGLRCLLDAAHVRSFGLIPSREQILQMVYVFALSAMQRSTLVNC
jgi:hypothetical protein